MDHNIASIVTARTVFEAGVPNLKTTKQCRRVDRACKQRATWLLLIDGRDQDSNRSIHFRDRTIQRHHRDRQTFLTRTTAPSDKGVSAACSDWLATTTCFFFLFDGLVR